MEHDQICHHDINHDPSEDCPSKTSSRVATCESNTIVSGSYANNTLSLVRQGGGSVDIPFEEVNSSVKLYHNSSMGGELLSVEVFGNRTRADNPGTVEFITTTSTYQNIFDYLDLDAEYDVNFNTEPPFTYRKPHTFAMKSPQSTRSETPLYRFDFEDAPSNTTKRGPNTLISCIEISKADSIISNVNYRVTNCYITGFSTSTAVMMAEPSASDNGMLTVEVIDENITLYNAPTSYYCNRYVGDIILDIYPSSESTFTII